MWYCGAEAMCARLAAGTQFERDALAPARRPSRRQPGGIPQRRWPGHGLLYGDVDEAAQERATHARIVCTFLDQLVFLPGLVLGTTSSAMRATRCTVRCARPPKRPIGLGSSDPIPWLVEQLLESSQQHRFPTTRHRARTGAGVLENARVDTIIAVSAGL